MAAGAMESTRALGAQNNSTKTTYVRTPDDRKINVYVPYKIHRCIDVEASTRDMSMLELVWHVLTWYVEDGPGSGKPSGTSELLGAKIQMEDNPPLKHPSSL